MLQVRTYLDKSPIDRLGLFAAEDIRKGTITWEFYPDVDIVLEEFCFGQIEFEFVTKYAFQDKQLGKYLRMMIDLRIILIIPIQVPYQMEKWLR